MCLTGDVAHCPSSFYSFLGRARRFVATIFLQFKDLSIPVRIFIGKIFFFSFQFDRLFFNHHQIIFTSTHFDFDPFLRDIVEERVKPPFPCRVKG